MQKQDNHSLRAYFLDRVGQSEGSQGRHVRQSLGIGALIGTSFSITIRNLVPVLAIGFVVSLLGALLAGSLVGVDAALNLETDDTSDLAGLVDLATAFVDVIVFAVTAAFLAQLTYDARLNRPVSIARYLLPALKASAPICLQNGLLVVIFVCIALPLVFIAIFVNTTLISITALAVLPFVALWGCSVFSVLAPAVVIERIGFGGMSRSWALTKTYRWQIAGALLPVWLCSLAVTIAGAFPVELLAHEGSYVWALPVFAATNALASGPLAILATLVYARLREIKEGISVDQVADVFD